MCRYKEWSLAIRSSSSEQFEIVAEIMRIRTGFHVEIEEALAQISNANLELREIQPNGGRTRRKFDATPFARRCLKSARRASSG